MRKNRFKVVAAFGIAIIILLTLSIYLQLELPASTGPYPVGQTVFRWVDTSRPEVLTESPTDFREVIALLWYPAENGTGAKSPYFPGLSEVSKALAESGEIESWKVFGLPFVRSQNLLNASPAKSETRFPVLMFSPGNGTNIEFYSALLSEIASHGYIVVGLNHPYDVAAVELSDHKIASFYKQQESLDMRANQAFVSERIKVRTLDVLFALDQLQILSQGDNSSFAGSMDLRLVAVAGHSLGGITASEACKADIRFRSCLNFDGLQKGGPFSSEASAIPPDQPFMFITKEAHLHPKLIEKFESTKESYWVVIHGATHDSFTDGPLLQPGLLPVSTRADQIMSQIQKYTVAFLDQTLKGQQSDLLAKSVKLANVTVNVYPSP
jgi:hypothetical protein